MKDNQKNIKAVLRAISDDVEETRTVTFVASTDSKDRHGTVLNQKNWDIKNFNNNPIIGYQHNVYGDGMCNEPDPDDQLAIAKAYFETTKKGTSEEKTELLVDITFEPAEINAKAEKIFRKILFGSLRAVSVGFIPLKDADGNKGAYGYKDINGETKNSDTYYYFGQELLEVSVVNIPSNPDALKRSYREDTTSALMFLTKKLDRRFADIEDMKVRDILDLLDGKEIQEKKPELDNVEEKVTKVCNMREKQLLLAKSKMKENSLT